MRRLALILILGVAACKGTDDTDVIDTDAQDTEIPDTDVEDTDVEDTDDTDVEDTDDTDVIGTDADGDGFDANIDCDDGNAAINPDATEVCDELDLDEDCDGLADDTTDPDAGATAFFVDADTDGFGTGAAVYACDPGPNLALVDGDCDDTDWNVYPTADEYCDDLDIDQDCDGLSDDDDPSVTGLLAWGADGDGDMHADMWGTTYLSCEPHSSNDWPADDCDDLDRFTFPGAEEVCDGKTNQCIDRWPPSGEDGIASIWDGTRWTDATRTLTATSPAALAIGSGETLHLCGGAAWNVQLTSNATAGVTCHNGGTLDGNAAWTPITVTGGTFSLDDCTIVGGSGTNGGAMSATDAIVNISNSSLSGQATGDGGGLYTLRTNVVLANNASIVNSKADVGAGYYGAEGYLDMRDSFVSGNSATTDGGGIYLFTQQATITQSQIASNSAGGSGGGAYVFDGSLAMIGVVVDDNSASANGGGLAMEGTSVGLTDSVVLFNTADVGGGLWLSGAGQGAYLYNSGLTDNIARLGAAADVGSNYSIELDTPSYVLRNGAGLTSAAFTLAYSAQLTSTADLGSGAGDNTPDDIDAGTVTYSYGQDTVACTLGLCTP